LFDFFVCFSEKGRGVVDNGFRSCLFLFLLQVMVLCFWLVG